MLKYAAILALLLASCSKDSSDTLTQPINQIGRTQAEIDQLSANEKHYCINVSYRKGLIWRNREFKSNYPITVSDIRRRVPPATDYNYKYYRC